VKIKDALKKLDPKKAGDWNDDGTPKLDRIRVLMKNSEVTQEDLTNEGEGFVRPDGNMKTKSRKALDARDEDGIPDDAIDPETGRFMLEDEDGKRRKIFVRNKYVAAAERGFAAGSIRDPGDKFMYTGELGSWMMDADHQFADVLAAQEAIEREERLKPKAVPVKTDGPAA
jgi:hypothetical protein